MTDLSELIDLCDPEEFTAIRESEGVVVDGLRRKRSDPERFPGSGVFHNAEAKTLERLDENTRTREVLTGYTEFELRIANIKRGELADKLELRGNRYQVHEVTPWPQGSFFEITCVRLGQ